MRIAMIGLRGLPATFGGIEKHVEELGWRLADRGHDVTVYCRPSYAASLATVPPEHGYVAPVGRAPGRYRGMTLQNLPAPEGKGLEAFGALTSCIFTRSDLASSRRYRSI